MIIPRITVDRAKCDRPLDCTVCLRVCPQAVFKLKPEKVSQFRENEASEFIVTTLYWVACVGCNLCVQQCPRQAITLAYEEIAEKEV